MKKLVGLLLAAVVLMVGCGSAPEPITMDEVAGYWYDAAEDGVYEFTADGMVIVHAAIKQDDVVISRFSLPVGTIVCGDEVKMMLAVGSETAEYVCEFSEDRNSVTFVSDAGTTSITRISKEEAAEKKVKVE